VLPARVSRIYDWTNATRSKVLPVRVSHIYDWTNAARTGSTVLRIMEFENMILHKLILKNFKQYTSEAIEFKENLVGITGRNGAGKSSVFEAILLALYGSFEVDNSRIMRIYMK